MGCRSSQVTGNKHQRKASQVKLTRGHEQRSKMQKFTVIYGGPYMKEMEKTKSEVSNHGPTEKLHFSA